MTIEAGPFYFAWVDEGTAFDPGVHNVMDEYIFSATRTLAEGDKPLLELEIRNPHIGILNPARKLWAWFSYDTGSTAGIVPLGLFRVVATPSNIFGEVITLQMVAWPIDYFEQLQRVAETMKVAPFYDDVFVDVAKRDDPDAILEGYSKRWHVDPVTHVVSASDILEAEDGNVDVTADHAFYDSLDMRMEQPPLTAILVDAAVNWTQTGRGYVDIGNRTFFSYSGDGIIDEWPKPLAQLGSGWSVSYSNAADVWGVKNLIVASTSWSWNNPEKEHSDGDTLSQSVSQTSPAMNGGFLQTILTQNIMPGRADPFAVDGDGDPSPINTPASADLTMLYCPQWQVSTSLVLRYDAARPRTERVIFLLQSDLQDVIVDPLVTQNSETISKTGADVGIPIVHLLNWSAVAGQAVALDQIVFPDNRKLPGGTSAQICVTAGTAGTTEPVFSDVPGDITIDGTVHWASLGTTQPTENAGDWTPDTHVPVGAMVRPLQPVSIPWTTLVLPGLAQFPKVGVSVSLGQVVQASNGSFQACTLEGTTKTTEPSFSTSWGATTVDGSVTWTSLGMSIPTGANLFLCTQAGETGDPYVIPQFGAHSAINDTVTDGTVVWTSIGSGDIPAGGVPGNVTRRSYFPTDRGRQSLEYLIAVARAHLVARARAVRISFETSFEVGIGISCRKTVTLHDSRLPGGVALGKVTQAVLSINGDKGEAKCAVTMACAVGKDTVIEEVPGEGVYAAAGYMQPGYQQTPSQIVLLPDSTDVGYSPLIDAPDDDGLVFPLTRSQVVVSDAVHGTLADQESGIRSAFKSAQQAAVLAAQTTPSFSASVANQIAITNLGANSVALQLSRNPIWYDLQLKPVNSGPFNAVYNVDVTRLSVPKMIDLAGASTP